MSRAHKQTCLYCDATYVVSRTAPGDHFPLAKRHGGSDCVPCCRECHSLKDRLRLDEWNPLMINKVCADFPRLSRETHIFLAKCIDSLNEANEAAGGRA